MRLHSSAEVRCHLVGWSSRPLVSAVRRCDPRGLLHGLLHAVSALASDSPAPGKDSGATRKHIVALVQSAHRTHSLAATSNRRADE